MKYLSCENDFILLFKKDIYWLCYEPLHAVLCVMWKHVKSQEISATLHIWHHYSKFFYSFFKRGQIHLTGVHARGCEAVALVFKQLKVEVCTPVTYVEKETEMFYGLIDIVDVLKLH